MNMRYPVKNGVLKSLRRLSVLGVLLITSCAFYSFKGTIPSHLKNLKIDLFDNRTAEFNIDQDLDQAITNRLLENRLLALSSAPDADSHIEGVIKAVRDDPSTYDKAENVLEYRLVLTGEVKWVDDTLNKPIYQKDFNEYGTYNSEVENAKLTTAEQRSRDDAKTEAIGKVVDLIVESMTEGW